MGTIRKCKPFNLFLMVIGIILFSTSCKKENDCYDEELYQLHKDDYCTMDCPGVKGCDGKTYCNECEANRKGIKITN